MGYGISRRVQWILLLSTFYSLSSQAATFTVGSDAGCTHADIPSALAAAEANPGADVIRLARNLAYTQVALSFTLTQVLDIHGGYANCSQPVSDGVYTTLDGSGGAAETVLRATIFNTGWLRLRWLRITGGDKAGAGEGGGIYAFSGPLEIRDSEITQNTAGYGGGIYVQWSSLILRDNVLVTSNTARYSGGGIYVESANFRMVDPGSLIAFNEAQGQSDSGYGGGLMFLNNIGYSDDTKLAEIGSGYGNLGAIYSNTARYGGGVAVYAAEDTDSEPVLHMYQGNAGLPAAIRGNFASVAGGAIYARGNIDRFPDLVSSTPRIDLWNVQLVDNAAPLGAAAWLENDEDPIWDDWFGTILRFNPGTPPEGAISCPFDDYCGKVVGNLSEDALGNPTDGPVFQVERGSGLFFNPSNSGGSSQGGVLVESNRGGSLINTHASHLSPSYNVVIADNESQYPLIRVLEGSFRLSQSTIVDNVISSAHVLGIAQGELELLNTLLWQPGKSSVLVQGGTLSVNNVFANEVATLGGPPGAYSVLSPRFVDPARGDYRLRAASEAIDRNLEVGGDDRDAFRRNRDIRIPIVQRPVGWVRDVGAFERQGLQPMILNSDFAIDLNLWNEVRAGSTSWVDDENGFGQGGALRVSTTSTANEHVTAASQCVHLPGPTLWALNGSGKSGAGAIGTRDQVYLRWELRHNGGEECNNGPADSSGIHSLTTSNSWVRPANPALIEQLPENWTVNSSLTVQLVVKENGISFPTSVSGWFDGITLELANPPPPAEMVFKDGFETE